MEKEHFDSYKCYVSFVAQFTTLKSLDYNVVMKFRFNNNNDDDDDKN